MIRLSFTMEDLRAFLEKLPITLRESAQQAMKDTGDEIVRTLRQPGRPRGGKKVVWDSEKQRRAYFATGGFGAGIPYKRTGKMAAAWENQAIANGYLIVNTEEKSVFVYGTALGVGNGRLTTPSGQSHIHVGYWPRFRPLVDNMLVRLPARVYAALRVRARVRG